MEFCGRIIYAKIIRDAPHGNVAKVILLRVQN